MLKSLTFLDVTTVVGAEAVDATADFVWAGSLFGGKLLDQLGVGSRFQARVPVTVTGQADVLTVRFELDRGVDASQETLDALRGDVELTVRPEEILAIEKPPADLSLSRQQVVALGDARVKQKCGL
jgi:ribose 1,5-bisphosphokinase PhnN